MWLRRSCAIAVGRAVAQHVALLIEVGRLVKVTSGAACHAAIMGDFGNVMIGEWGAGLEIIVDPFTLARRNLLQVTSLLFVDVQVTMPNAFAVYRDLLV